MRLRNGLGSALAGVMLALVTVVPGAYASTPEQMLRALKAQRAANGLKKPVTLSPQLTEGCARHIGYMEQNGFGHGEEEGRPGYTDAGAGNGEYRFDSENLGPGPYRWTARDNQFARDTAHLRDHLHPNLTEVGYAETGRMMCIRFRFGREASGYSFAADPRGPRQVYVGGVLGDGEAEEAGLPRGTETGPALLLYHLAKGARLEPLSYSLTGRGKRVKVSLWGDYAYVGEDGRRVAGHENVSTMLPHSPLRPWTEYTGRVRWRLDDGSVETQRFTFRTTGSANALYMAEPANGGLVVWSLARNMSVVLKGGGRRIAREARAKRRGSFRLNGRRLWEVVFDVRKARGRTWRTCARSGGPRTRYERIATCATFAYRR
jgi:hypothetical protein